jgi:hypothetical protein
METTANNTASNNVDEKLSAMNEAIANLGGIVAKFAETLTNTLTGETSTPRTIQRRKPINNDGYSVNGKKLGRPPTKPVAVPDAPPAEKPLHPIAIEMMNRVHKEGRVKLSDLADKAKINRSLIHYHIAPLVEKGHIVVVRHVVNGKKNDVAYKPDRVLIRS